jgi:hypothetical protein
VAAAPLHVTDATPESASETLPDTEAGVEVNVAPLAGDAMVTTGGVRSIFNVTVAVAVSPAASVTVPVIVWLAPAVLTIWDAGQLAIGADPGVQVKLTVTEVSFQPLAFGAGVAVARIVGATRSMFTVVVNVALLPATSVTVPVTC